MTIIPKIKVGPSGSAERRHDFVLVILPGGPTFFSEEAMIICTKCKQEKPVEDFYKDRASKDGWQSYCKVCKQAYKQTDKSKKAQRRYDQSDKRKEAKHHYRQTEQGKKATNKAVRKYRKKHPLTAIAHYKLNNSIRDGKLIRDPCEVCGSTDRIHGHHDDYSKHLDVNWLCRKHHMRRHKELGPVPAPIL